MASSGLIESMRYLAIGFKLVRTRGLRRFVWMPLLVNLLVFGGLGWWIYSAASSWLDAFTLFDRFSDFWIIQLLETLLRWLFGLVLFLVLGFVFTLLANLIGAPFNGLLAERVEAHLTGNTAPAAPPVMMMIKSLPRLMGSELGKLVYMVIFLVPLLLLQLIPIVNLVAPVLLFMFGAWMFALEYLDYPMGNHGALFRDVRRAVRQKRKTAFGFGVIVALFSLVPILNLFIMPIAVAGATALYVDHWPDSSLQPQSS
ncbi:MAG: sulfate transporter CysZ [Granulosicoccus sp.]